MNTYWVEYVDGLGNVAVAEVQAISPSQAIDVLMAQGFYQGYEYEVLRVGSPA